MGRIYSSLFAAALAVLAFGCSQQITKEEQQVREIATKYHDAYVDGFSVAGSEQTATNLLRGTIQSVQTCSNGWDVVFATKVNGKLGYFLHIYVEPDGRLNRIVRDSAR